MGPVMELRKAMRGFGTGNTKRPCPWLQAALADSEVAVSSGVDRT